MFHISEVKTTPPTEFKNDLQQMAYATLQKLQIPFERVDTDEAITMEDCVLIDQRLKMQTVKTLFLCNRQQTDFYLFITTADKPFRTKELSAALNIARLSFAPADLLEKMLGTKVGAATIFGLMLDTNRAVKLLLDRAILSAEDYGCSDGTTTSYMKIKTTHVLNDFLQHIHREAVVVDI